MNGTKNLELGFTTKKRIFSYPYRVIDKDREVGHRTLIHVLWQFIQNTLPFVQNDIYTAPLLYILGLMFKMRLKLYKKSVEPF